MNFPKRCACGLVFLNEAAWKELLYVGVIGPYLFAPDEDPEHLEMRNCPCGSTLAIDLTEGQPS